MRIIVDVISDIVCPWCSIGARRLETALGAHPEIDADLTFRPFLLDPATPMEGADLREKLRRKYGDPEPMFRRVEVAARESGVAMDLSKVRRAAATVRPHTLMRHAIEKKTQRALARALFDAYFAEGRDIGAMDVLIDVAGRHGFSEAETIAICESPEELAATRAEAAEATARGVTGVPLAIVRRPSTSEHVAVSGAQPPAVFERAILRASGVGGPGA